MSKALRNFGSGMGTTFTYEVPSNGQPLNPAPGTVTAYAYAPNSAVQALTPTTPPADSTQPAPSATLTVNNPKAPTPKKGGTSVGKIIAGLVLAVAGTGLAIKLSKRG